MAGQEGVATGWVDFTEFENTTVIVARNPNWKPIEDAQQLNGVDLGPSSIETLPDGSIRVHVPEAHERLAKHFAGKEGGSHAIP